MMVEVETHSYDDDGGVEAETVITTDSTEFVVVQSKGRDAHRVYEREPGITKPERELTSE